MKKLLFISILCPVLALAGVAPVLMNPYTTNTTDAADSRVIALSTGTNSITWIDPLGKGKNTNYAFSIDATGTNDNSTQIGKGASGTNYGIAIGNNSTGNDHGVAIGRESNGTNYGTAIGPASTGPNYGTAIGPASSTTDGSVAIGFSSTASGPHNISVGQRAYTYGTNCVSIGDDCIVQGTNNTNAQPTPLNNCISIGRPVAGMGTPTAVATNSGVWFMGNRVFDENGFLVSGSQPKAIINNVTIKGSGNVITNGSSNTNLVNDAGYLTISDPASIATATNAQFASESAHATNSDLATYSTSSGYATNSGSANTAGYSDSSGYATNANHATHADSADYVTYITNKISYTTNATYADSAGYATNAAYADSTAYSTNSSTASFASSADQSSYATNAGSASFATISADSTNAQAATYATSSGYSTNAGNATTAGTAAIAINATNAESSGTSTNSLACSGNAATATTATNALTATYATGAGYSTNADSAGFATIAASATNAQLATIAITATNLVNFTNNVQNIIAASVGTSIYAYNTTNIYGTNKYASTNYMYSTNLPVKFSRTYTIVSNSQYLGGVILTNVTSIVAGIECGIYESGISAGSNSRLTNHAELYYSYDNGATLEGDWDSDNREIAIGDTNIYSYTFANPPLQFTNPVWLIRMLKVDSFNNANFMILGGGATPSYLHLTTKPTGGGGGGAGDVTAAGDNSFTGANTFIEKPVTFSGTNTANESANLRVYSGAANLQVLSSNTVATNTFMFYGSGNLSAAGTVTAGGLNILNSINQALAFVNSSNCVVNFASFAGNVTRTYVLSMTNNVTFTMTNATANTDFSWETIQAGTGSYTATINTNYVAGAVKLSPPTFGQLVTHPTGVGARMQWSCHVWSTGTNATVWQLPMTSGL